MRDKPMPPPQGASGVRAVPTAHRLWLNVVTMSMQPGGCRVYATWWLQIVSCDMSRNATPSCDTESRGQRTGGILQSVAAVIQEEGD